MIREAIAALSDGRDLSPAEAAGAMGEILAGQATPAQIAGFLVALRAKGESAPEIAAMARAMRERSIRISPKVAGPLVDTCGTGGDRVRTFNVSTSAALVVAGAGVPVAKHGNRSVTGPCGSADLLEALGVNLSAPAGDVERSIERANIGFLFAPMFHPAMRHAGPVRKELGIRTAFNLLGPLTNPAGAQVQLVGVYDPALTGLVAKVLRLLGTKSALVVHGAPGVDEISLAGPTRAVEVSRSKVRTLTLNPSDFGLKRLPPAAVPAAPPEESARRLVALLRGERGPLRDSVAANAAALLKIGGKARTWREGVEVAARSIDSGAALAALRGLVEHGGGDLRRLERLGG
ncbi:MAG: anthranilate phosphoribosyltransferase [Halobacteria archaeon]